MELKSIYRLAYDGKLISGLLAVFLRVVTAWYVRQALPPGPSARPVGKATEGRVAAR